MTSEDADLIERFLAATEGLTQVEAAERGGVGQRTVSRWRAGERTPLRTGTRTALVRFFRESDYEDSDESEARSIVINPNLARRLVGEVKPEDKRTRLAIVQEIESAFVEANEGIPSWLEELRREVLG